MSKGKHIEWLDSPKDGNYPAAHSYLSLIYPRNQVDHFLDCFGRAPITQFMAKDIFRASGLSLLGISNDRIKHDRRLIKKGRPLSPLLLVRDAQNGKVVIADGYHRLCAIYSFHEDIWIKCKIV